MNNTEIQYLSYSGWKTYDPSSNGCPLRYKYKYIDSDPLIRDPSNSIFGSTIGKVFEWFYEEKLWSTGDPVASTIGRVEKALEVVLKENNFNPDSQFMNYIIDETKRFIPSSIENIRKHKLLTEESRAEVKLHVTYSHKDYDFSLRLGGYADFIHGLRDPWIIDGKAYSDRELWSDPDQLIWYAVQHYLKFRVAPTRLGFFYYKFPENPIDWINYDENDMRRILKKTYESAKNIRLKMFDPHPSKKCKFCEYLKGCVPGKKLTDALAVESNSNVDFNECMFGVESI